MSNPEHLAKLLEGVEAWNEWRKANKFEVRPDLFGADLREAKLKEANLREAYLMEANLSGADLTGASLTDADLRAANLSKAGLGEAYLSGAILGGANLSGAMLYRANLGGADLRDANLKESNLIEAYLFKANLSDANLSEANLHEANLHLANLSQANLRGANLSQADLSRANLTEADLNGVDLDRANLSAANLSAANLKGANFTKASLVDTNLEGADLTGCNVYGISVWNARLDRTKQSNLLITPEEEPAIRVDNLEVAQFVYLLLNNAKIRHVIDTITSKVVLILGRFTPERKVVLDAIREELRKRDYVPVLFDFDKPSTRDTHETIVTLAGLARFVIADISDPKSVPQELGSIVPTLPSVPVQPLLQTGFEPWGMYDHIKKYGWVLPLLEYQSEKELLQDLELRVIAPAEEKAKELTRK